MSKNYCSCGCPNDFDAKFCKRCGGSMAIGSATKEDETNADVLPQPAPKAKSKVRIPQEPEEGDEGVMTKKGRRYSTPPKPPVVKAREEEEDTTDEDEEGEGESLDFVPDVDKLAFDPIAPLPRLGESWASMLQQAEIEKRRTGQ